MQFKRFFNHALLSLGVLVGSAVLTGTLQAQEIPVETFFKKSAYGALILSPNRKSLAAVAPRANERMNVIVVDLEKRTARPVTDFNDVDISTIFWATDNRIIFTTGDQQGLEFRGNGGLYAVNADGTEPKTLVPPFAGRGGQVVLRATSVLRRVKGSKDEVYVSANDRSADSQDVYKMNIFTGRKSLVTTDSPGNVQGWLLDGDGVPRVAMSSDLEKKRYWFSYRVDSQSPWKTVAEWNENLENVVIPVGFDQVDRKRLIVRSNRGRDTLAYFYFNPETGELGKLIYGNDRYDMGGYGVPAGDSGAYSELLYSEDTAEQKGVISGVAFLGNGREVVWFDEAEKALQTRLDRALPGRTNSFVSSKGRQLVTSQSSQQPPVYFIYDADKPSLEETGLAARPWIDEKAMRPVVTVEWKARDGLLIEGLLTLPAGYTKGKPVPLILHPHGGPWARDVGLRFNPEVQFMANRGYAVLQPNFRGSPGFGRKHFMASYKQWGGTMIDDMIDGVRWAIAQGYADPARLGVYGASYGGYSALMAVIKEPDMFKWAINYVGVTDMFVHQDTQPAQRRGNFGQMAKALNGDQRADAAMFEATSPARLVSKIKAPVFHAYGGEDQNVDFANGRVIKDAFEKANKPFEWMFVADEAHGYRFTKNVNAYYAAFDKFIKTHTPASK